MPRTGLIIYFSFQFFVSCASSFIELESENKRSISSQVKKSKSCQNILKTLLIKENQRLKLLPKAFWERLKNYKSAKEINPRQDINTNDLEWVFVYRGVSVAPGKIDLNYNYKGDGYFKADFVTSNPTYAMDFAKEGFVFERLEKYMGCEQGPSIILTDEAFKMMAFGLYSITHVDNLRE